MQTLKAPAYGYFVEKYGEDDSTAPARAAIAASGAADAIDAIFEGAYAMLQILGGEVKYLYTTKQGHEVEMSISIPE